MGQLGGRHASRPIPGSRLQGPCPLERPRACNHGGHPHAGISHAAPSHLTQLSRGGRRHRRRECHCQTDRDDQTAHPVNTKIQDPRSQITTNLSSRSLLIDPQALMSIRNLELRARVVVEGFWNGLHRSPYHGFSVEFTEYRQYSPGDDPRYVYWRVFARSDLYFINKFEDETNLRCYLLADNSRSMGFSSLSYTKAEYAATLAATLAYFLYLQGDAVGLLTFDEQIREYLPARHRTGHLRHLMLRLEQPAGGQTTDLAAPLKRIVEIVRKRGLIVILSDLLGPIGTLEKDLTALSACGHEVVLFHILDPVELNFAFE